MSRRSVGLVSLLLLGIVTGAFAEETMERPLGGPFPTTVDPGRSMGDVDTPGPNAPPGQPGPRLICVVPPSTNAPPMSCEATGDHPNSPCTCAGNPTAGVSVYAQ